MICILTFCKYLRALEVIVYATFGLETKHFWNTIKEYITANADIDAWMIRDAIVPHRIVDMVIVERGSREPITTKVIKHCKFFVFKCWVAMTITT